MSAATSTLLLADDHQLLREGLRLLLGQLPQLHIIAETGDGLAVLPLLQQHQPTLAVIDHSLPGLSGLEIIREATRLALPTRIILLTSYSKPMLVADALDAGASAFVVKDNAFAELRAAVQQVLQGELYLSHDIDRQALSTALASTRITEREHSVLRALIRGLSAKEIAEQLNLSPRTVETHRNHLMAKLAARTTPELIAQALATGYGPRD